MLAAVCGADGLLPCLALAGCLCWWCQQPLLPHRDVLVPGHCLWACQNVCQWVHHKCIRLQGLHRTRGCSMQHTDIHTITVAAKPHAGGSSHRLVCFNPRAYSCQQWTMTEWGMFCLLDGKPQLPRCDNDSASAASAYCPQCSACAAQ